jgi:hypothetical protein
MSLPLPFALRGTPQIAFDHDGYWQVRCDNATCDHLLNQAKRIGVHVDPTDWDSELMWTDQPGPQRALCPPCGFGRLADGTLVGVAWAAVVRAAETAELFGDDQ